MESHAQRYTLCVWLGPLPTLPYHSTRMGYRVRKVLIGPINRGPESLGYCGVCRRNQVDDCAVQGWIQLISEGLYYPTNIA